MNSRLNYFVVILLELYGIILSRYCLIEISAKIDSAKIDAWLRSLAAAVAL